MRHDWGERVNEVNKVIKVYRVDASMNNKER